MRPDNSRMRLPAAVLLALIALGLSGCGPTDEEVGRAILLTAVVPHALGMALMFVFHALWRPLKPDAVISLKPLLVALGVLVVAAGLSLVGVTEQGPDHPDSSGVEGVVWLATIALAAFGTSYLALWLVVWRIWLAKSPRTAFTWSFLPVLAILIWPCPIMATGVTESSDAWHVLMTPNYYLWYYSGYGGLVASPVIISLLIEGLIRRRRLNAQPSEPKE